MADIEKTLLHRLARHYNVQTSFYNVSGQLKHSSPEGLIRVLRALGAPLEKIHDVPDALRERRQSLWQLCLDPVLVAWDGKPLRLKLRLPLNAVERKIRYQIQLESGNRFSGTGIPDPLARMEKKEVEGNRYVAHRVTLPEKLPLGYHELNLKVGKKSFASHIISAPLQAYTPSVGSLRTWGLFCPLYGLRSHTSWGAGNFSDLERVTDWIEELGGEVIATLPLLAAFLDEPFDPSPYSPVSRLFWNEFYLDVNRIPELESCPEAEEILGSSKFMKDLEECRSASLIDYRRQMALRRKVLEALAKSLTKKDSARLSTFRGFVQSHPVAADYAAFRAMVESQRTAWTQWPEAGREGALYPGDYSEEVKQYHLYVQWLAHEQIHALGDKAKSRGRGLYLDFPLGVNRDGYDVWRERKVFALDCTGGAPPDTFFTKGQDWGFPPLHPEELRRDGYRYYLLSLRHHLKYSGLLRIDHVMGLHRLYWIPRGLEPKYGVYVRYQAEEFYAILNLESHRHQASIVGENLGTVHPSVNEALARHKIFGMYVGQFGINPNSEKALDEVPSGTVASLNTHDTPTFEAFWSGMDVDDRLDLGLLNQEESVVEREARIKQKEALIRFLQRRGWLEGESPDAQAVLKAWLAHLSSGSPELVLINLEDLWLEPNPQNVPGTWEERPNWKRKSRHSIEEFFPMETVLDTLKAVDEVRQRRR